MCVTMTDTPPPVNAKAEAMDATLISSGAHTYVGRTRAIMTASYLLCFGCIGVCLGSLGPILLALSERLREDVDTLGMLFVFRSAGYLGGSLAAGWLFDFVTRPHAILLLAILTCAVGTASIPLWRDYRAVGAALSTQGACMGVLDTGGNVLMIWLWDPAAHGLWNLTKLAVQEAGFMGIMYHTQMLVNWRAAFGESIQDIGG